jgi:hypothetical protein
MLGDLAGTGALHDALETTNGLLEQVLTELRRVNDERLAAVTSELRRLNDDRLAAMTSELAALRGDLHERG